MSREKFRAACFLLLGEGPQVLLLRRSNTGWCDGKFSLIAGHVEFDEPPTLAMVREAREEAGIEVAQADLECIQIVHRFSDDGLVYVDYFFRASKWQGDPKVMEPDKCSEVAWHSIHSLPSDTIPYVREVLERIHSGKRGLFEFGWR